MRQQRHHFAVQQPAPIFERVAHHFPAREEQEVEREEVEVRPFAEVVLQHVEEGVTFGIIGNDLASDDGAVGKCFEYTRYDRKSRVEVRALGDLSCTLPAVLMPCAQ